MKTVGSFWRKVRLCLSVVFVHRLQVLKKFYFIYMSFLPLFSTSPAVKENAPIFTGNVRNPLPMAILQCSPATV